MEMSEDIRAHSLKSIKIGRKGPSKGLGKGKCQAEDHDGHMCTMQM